MPQRKSFVKRGGRAGGGEWARRVVCGASRPGLSFLSTSFEAEAQATYSGADARNACFHYFMVYKVSIGLRGPWFCFLAPLAAGRRDVRGRSGRGHDAVLHGVRGPRGENRGQVLQAVPQDDGPHDLGGPRAGEAVHSVRDAARGEGGKQGPWRVTTICFR